jgi:predicted PurR-regulated permease PerM
MQRTDYGRIAVLVLLAVVLYYVVRILLPFLPALAWATILATVFYPLFGRVSRLVRRPGLASALTCVLLTLAIVLPVMVLLFLLAGESVNAYRMLEARIKSGGAGELAQLRNASTYQWFLAKLQALGLPEPNLSEAAMRALRGVSEFLVGHSASVLSGLMHFALNFFVMLFTLYYLFLRGPDILRELSRLSPLRHEHEERIVGKFRDIAQATFAGSLATALIQGTAGGLVFLFFGLWSPLLWGAVMALLSLVPVVGTALIWGPVAVYYLLTGVIWKGLLLIVIFVGIVGSADNVVKPRLIKRGTGIHTLWVFLGILGGVGVFGFLGFVLGPFCVTILFVLIEIYKVEFGEELGKNVAP